MAGIYHDRKGEGVVDPNSKEGKDLEEEG